jgi:hypothetical protein
MCVGWDVGTLPRPTPDKELDTSSWYALTYTLSRGYPREETVRLSLALSHPRGQHPRG